MRKIQLGHWYLIEKIFHAKPLNTRVMHQYHTTIAQK
jgi:hypothetical protein